MGLIAGNEQTNTVGKGAKEQMYAAWPRVHGSARACVPVAA